MRMDEGKKVVKQSRSRGRPARRQKARPSSKLQLAGTVHEVATPYHQSPAYDDALEEAQLSPFSALLQHILKQDRPEIARVAAALEVSENTVYRWFHGSEPRTVHLKNLVEALPEHRRDLIEAIEQTFPGTLDALFTPAIREVQKDIYRRVLDLVTMTVEDDTRRWQVTSAVFEAALEQLDSEHQGLAITYADLLAPRADGIHSLYEAEMRGTAPWHLSQESKAYLGSTTLAGTAAMFQRMQIWDDRGGEERQQFVVDEFERSACACPVMRAGRISGVLIVSSTQPDFFSQPMITQAVAEYAQLLALGLKEENFYPCSLVHLRPMPDAKWQREEISRTFMERVIACARQSGLSRSEAELQVRKEMEAEFELQADLPHDLPSSPV